MWRTVTTFAFFFAAFLQVVAAPQFSLQAWAAKRAEAVEAFRAGRFRDAEPLGREALALAGPSPNEPVATSANDLGLILNEGAKYADAAAQFEHAIAIEAKLFPADSPAMAAVYNDLGGVDYRLGKYAEADRAYRRAVEIFDLTDNSANPQFIATLSNYGALCYQMGRYGDAERLHTRAMRLGEKALPEYDPVLIRSVNGLALPSFRFFGFIEHWLTLASTVPQP